MKYQYQNMPWVAVQAFRRIEEADKRPKGHPDYLSKAEMCGIARRILFDLLVEVERTHVTRSEAT